MCDSCVSFMMPTSTQLQRWLRKLSHYSARPCANTWLGGALPRPSATPGEIFADRHCGALCDQRRCTFVVLTGVLHPAHLCALLCLHARCQSRHHVRGVPSSTPLLVKGSREWPAQETACKCPVEVRSHFALRFLNAAQFLLPICTQSAHAPSSTGWRRSGWRSPPFC